MSTLAARRAATPLRRQQLPKDEPFAAMPRAAIVRLYVRIREWRRDGRARAALARMSMRDLQDIGVTPAERDRECHKRLWQF